MLGDGARWFLLDKMVRHNVLPSAISTYLWRSRRPALLALRQRIASYLAEPERYTFAWCSGRVNPSAIHRLTEHGVELERYEFADQDELGIWATPGGALVAWFKDPDGNILSVVQE